MSTNEENPTPTTEVEQRLAELHRVADTDRQEAAAALSRLGVWQRGSVRTRGGLAQAAVSRLPNPRQLDELARHLADPDPKVRRQVALALGEWGDGRAVEPLARLLADDPEEEVRLYAVTALRLLGGPAALDALCQAVAGGTEAVRTAAVVAVEDLATGGRRDDSEPPEMAPPKSGAVRVRGGGGTRGTAPTETLDRVTGVLERVRGDSAAGDYLRHRAAEVLDYLRE